MNNEIELLTFTPAKGIDQYEGGTPNSAGIYA